MVKLERALAGQNLSWGATVEDAASFWRKLDIDHMLIKKAKNFLPFDLHGNIIESAFEELSKIQEEHGMEFHLHPYHHRIDDVVTDPGDINAHEVIRNFLTNLDSAAEKYDLQPVIIVHPAVFFSKRNKVLVPEEIALKNNSIFSSGFKLKYCKLAWENIPEPEYIPGYGLLSYTASHFKSLIGQNENAGICIDAGHLNLSSNTASSLINLGYPILAMHLHGNDGKLDTHNLPMPDNFILAEDAILAMRACQCPISIEAKNHNYTKQQVKESVDFIRSML
jgi:sugar phosphate isomerase/epimerase